MCVLARAIHNSQNATSLCFCWILQIFEYICYDLLTNYNVIAKSQIASMHCESSSCSSFSSKPKVASSTSSSLYPSCFFSSSHSRLLSRRWNAIDSMYIWQQDSSQLSTHLTYRVVFVCTRSLDKKIDRDCDR